jgi:Na+-driven multidrug efflux pump
VVAQAIGVVVTYAWMSTGRARPLGPPSVFGRIDVGLVVRLFRIGAPAAVDLAIVSASFVAFVRMLSHVDPAAVGAHGIGLRVMSLAYVLGFGVSQATSAMVGTALGADRADVARSVARSATGLSVSVMGAVGLGIVLAADPIAVWVFGSTRGTSLYTYAVEWMRILGMTMPLAGVHVALVGVLRGSGATPTSLLINALGTFVVQVPTSLVLGFAMGLGATGVWVGMPAAMLARAALAVRAYRQGAWARTGAHA